MFRAGALSLVLHRFPATTRALSRTMSGSKAYSTTNLLINDPQYSWLRRLGLQEENPGVFDGTWHASGPVCPFVQLECLMHFTPFRLSTLTTSVCVMDVQYNVL